MAAALPTTGWVAPWCRLWRLEISPLRTSPCSARVPTPYLWRALFVRPCRGPPSRVFRVPSGEPGSGLVMRRAFGLGH